MLQLQPGQRVVIRTLERTLVESFVIECHTAIVIGQKLQQCPPPVDECEQVTRAGIALHARTHQTSFNALFARTQEVIRFEGTVVHYDLIHVNFCLESEGELPQTGAGNELAKNISQDARASRAMGPDGRLSADQ